LNIASPAALQEGVMQQNPTASKLRGKYFKLKEWLSGNKTFCVIEPNKRIFNKV
jgi:hypothetical protein